MIKPSQSQYILVKINLVVQPYTIYYNQYTYSMHHIHVRYMMLLAWSRKTNWINIVYVNTYNTEQKDNPPPSPYTSNDVVSFEFTIKQRKENILVFLTNNFIFTNRKEVKFCFSL